MAQFQVPQFIETEEKIIGPLTIKQFGYLAVGGALSAGCFLIFNLVVAIIFITVFAVISVCLAFVRINGREMTKFASSAFNYIWAPKLYLFKIKMEGVETIQKRSKILSDSHTNTSGLRDLGDQLVGTKSAISRREQALPPSANPTQQEIKERYEIVQAISGAKDLARRVDYR